MTETPDIVERLRTLESQATPAPWFTLDAPWLPGGCETSILSESPDPHVARWICDFDFPMMDEDDRLSECPGADADLIVHARNALTELLTTIEALTAERDGLRAKLEAAEEALEPFVEGAAHTSVFLRSREKMHPAGQDLYAEDVQRAAATLTQIRSADGD